MKYNIITDEIKYENLTLSEILNKIIDLLNENKEIKIIPVNEETDGIVMLQGQPITVNGEPVTFKQLTNALLVGEQL